MAHLMSVHGTNRVIQVQADQTILDAALASGIDYPHGCRSGRCGACKTRLVEGDVEMLAHTRFALSDAERQDGYILACRAVPRTSGSILLPGQDEVPPEHPRQNLLCRVISTSSATHDIRHIRLAVESGGPFTYSPGQYARITLPGAPPRDYSMASLPGQDHLEFLVRRVPDGITSTRMTSVLKIGDAVQVEGPFGSAYLRERHAGPILCVAGGSGLAPIKSIVAAAAVAGLEQPIHVYFGARSERDLYLVEWFTALSSVHPNLTFIPVLSEPDAPTAHRTGLVADAIASDLTDLDGWKAYVAGPPAMVEATGRVLQQRGLQSRDLHADVFFTPELAPAA
ncbi:2Fe-2S iron-sulfur cluster-binding protein [Microvirga sp. GCM10011540]|uniref:2Fe-2S iron-sulfur cluster-binding protein n=1 Tax=Microvirga sp. GCM10011540 TaxID=3317338 RepID=UPI0036228725